MRKYKQFVDIVAFLNTLASIYIMLQCTVNMYLKPGYI